MIKSGKFISALLLSSALICATIPVSYTHLDVYKRQTMNIPVRRVLPHENIQMVGLTTTELSNKTSNNWLNGIASDNNVIISAP